MVKFGRSKPPAIFASYPHDAYLTVQMRHRIGSLELDVDLKLTKPWTILFGPSGAGKTTILRAIAGLIRPESALIVSYPKPVSSKKTGEVLVDTNAGICLPSHQRGMPLASQRPALFPNMTVAENLRFGHPGVGGGPQEADLAAFTATMSRRFHIQDLLDKLPAELSGGEAERVNLARATMARQKRAVLLDEPFSGLDIPLRDALIASLLQWQKKSNTPILSVTHDVAEAFQLGAEVIKLADGRVVEQGPVELVLAEERARLLAQLNGAAGSPA